eukprot:UN01925
MVLPVSYWSLFDIEGPVSTKAESVRLQNDEIAKIYLHETNPLTVIDGPVYTQYKAQMGMVDNPKDPNNLTSLQKQISVGFKLVDRSSFYLGYQNRSVPRSCFLYSATEEVLSAPLCETCDDSMQNQDEEGVDCGGVCPACETCDDGIQNQDEEGVDCGGVCPACETCDDGIQNQDEAGVDCGGVCPACETCDDGIQNQDETGVDCGGEFCPACPTCDDGIINQDETGVIAEVSVHHALHRAMMVFKMEMKLTLTVEVISVQHAKHAMMVFKIKMKKALTVVESAQHAKHAMMVSRIKMKEVLIAEVKDAHHANRARMVFKIKMKRVSIVEVFVQNAMWTVTTNGVSAMKIAKEHIQSTQNNLEKDYLARRNQHVIRERETVQDLKLIVKVSGENVTVIANVHGIQQLNQVRTVKDVQLKCLHAKLAKMTAKRNPKNQTHMTNTHTTIIHTTITLMTLMTIILTTTLAKDMTTLVKDTTTPVKDMTPPKTMRTAKTVTKNVMRKR